MKLELLEIRLVTQAVGGATMKGADAPLVAALLSKLEKEYNRLEKLEKKKQTEEIYLHEH
jgi:hypothetical protein|tara:strand:+ start:95 stop:274 length:180 start_codon:yes stop_codon:yes gene_type:complete